MGEGMENDDTMIFDIGTINKNLVYENIKDVYDILKERGYNPINQIVGYIISGDLGYISSYKNARSKIASLDRNTLVEVMLKNFLSWDI